MYSKIPLIQLAWDRTGAEVLNIPNDPAVHIVTQALTSNCFLLSYTWVAQIIGRVFQLGYLLHFPFHVNRQFFCIFWSPYYWSYLWSRREEVRRKRIDWSTDTSESILNMSLKSASFYDKPFFLVKTKTFGFWTTLLMCSNIKISKLSDVR